jgi:WD40 repeat protein
LKVSWSPDGERISAGSADKCVYIWEKMSGKILYKLPGHLGSVNEVDFHPFEPISKNLFFYKFWLKVLILTKSIVLFPNFSFDTKLLFFNSCIMFK